MHLSFIGIGSKIEKKLPIKICMGDDSIQKAIGKGCKDISMTIKRMSFLECLLT